MMLKQNKALQTKWQWVSTVVLLTLVGLFLGSTPPAAYAATCTSAATGLWSAPATWSTCGGVVPTAADDVTIMAGHTVTLDVAPFAAKNVTIDATGILDAATFTLNVTGNWTNNGTFTAGTSTVNFNGAAAQTIGGTSATAFNVMSTNNAGTVVTLGANTTAKDVTIGAGSTLAAATFTLDVAGNWTNNGTFTAGTSTVNFNGTGAQTITGVTTFNKMNISNGGRTVTFANDVTLGAASTWGGTSCTNLLSIRSSVAATGRTVTNGAFLTANFVDVQDSLLTTGVTAANGVKGTNSTNWTITTPCPPPAAPTFLGAAAASATQIDLGWTDMSSDETGFIVERSLTGTGGWAAITGSPTAINAQTESDTGLTCNTTYYYQVRATNAGGDSANITANATTSACPTAPTGLSATAASATQINLGWTDMSSNETGFKIYRNGTELLPSPKGAAGAGTGTIIMFNDTGLTCGTTYNYAVNATNATGDSANITANATTSSCPGVTIGAAMLAASAGTIAGQLPKTPTEAVALCNNTPLPTGYSFPYGAFVYTVGGLPSGGTTNMTLTLPGTLPVGSKIFKCNSANQWVPLTNTSDNGDAVVNFSLTDGVSNTDHDGTANGTIVDPAVPAVTASAVGGVAEIIAMPTASTNGLGYLAGLAGVVMLVGAGWLLKK